MRKGKMTVTAEVKGTEGTIKIVDYIGDWNANSSSIRDAVDYFTGKGVNDVTVYINSQGGSVLEATEIVNELKKLSNVTVRVGALAASAATYIMAHFYTVAGRSSQFMIHKPSITVSGNDSKIKSDLKLLENLTKDYLSTYAEKTGMTEEEIDTLWKDGDYWMDAEEALAKKFIDKIEDDQEAFLEHEVALLEAVGAPYVPEIKKPKNKFTNMELVAVIAALGLAADANEQKVLDEIKALKEKADGYDQLVAQQQEILQQRAETLVDQAILEKKIDAKQKDTYQKLAENDFDSVKALFEGMPALPKLSAQLNPSGGDSAEASRANWTMEDYLDKAPEALKELEKNNPEKYKQLEAAYFKA